MKFSSTQSVFALLVLVSVTAGCRFKARHDPSPPPPPPDRPETMSDLGQLCTGAKKGFADVKAYTKHTDGSPSRMAILQHGERSKSASERALDPSYAPITYSTLAGFAGNTLISELTVCVDMLDTVTDDVGYCSYYGAKVAMRGREFDVRVLETATGKVLSEEKFTTSARTEPCPATVHGSGNLYVSAEKRILAMVAPLEPETTKLPPATMADLIGVCAGTGVPQAGAGDSGAVDVVFFPGKSKSWENQWPSGMHFADEGKRPTLVTDVSRVLCVTQVPQKLVQSCEFTGGKVLDVYAGEFEAELRDARTAQVVETRHFKGVGSACPTLHSFKDSRDVFIPGIEASYKDYVLGLAPPATRTHAFQRQPSTGAKEL